MEVSRQKLRDALEKICGSDSDVVVLHGGTRVHFAAPASEGYQSGNALHH
jgi:hypothetical protein